MEKSFNSIEKYLKTVYGKEIAVRRFENINNDDYQHFAIHFNKKDRDKVLYQPAVFSNDKGTTFFVIMSFNCCYTDYYSEGYYFEMCPGNFGRKKYFEACRCMIDDGYLDAEFKILKLNDVWEHLPEEARLTVYEENPGYVYEKYGSEAGEWYFKTRKELNAKMSGIYDAQTARRMRKEKQEK